MLNYRSLVGNSSQGQVAEVLYRTPKRLTKKRAPASLSLSSVTSKRGTPASRKRRVATEKPPMAKQSKKSERSKAGKKAYRDKIKAAMAAGKKTVGVGKNRVSVKDAAHKLGLSGDKGKGKSGGKKGKRAKKATMASAFGHAGSHGGKRKSSKSKPAKRSKRRARQVVTKTRTVTKRLPGRTRTRTVRHVVTRKIRGNLAENPLTGMELFAGGLTLLLGLGVADVTDRMLATHALTTDPNGNFVDTPPVDSSGKPTALSNLPQVLSPMDTKRWLAGGVVVVVPFVAAAFVSGSKHATLRSALQLFGFGAAARVLGKGLKDLVVRFGGKNATVERLYPDEVAGYNSQAVLVQSQGGTPGPSFMPQSPVQLSTLAGAPGMGHARTNHSEVGGRTNGSGDRPAHRPGGCSCGGTCDKCSKGLSSPVGAPPPPPPHVQQQQVAPPQALPAPKSEASMPFVTERPKPTYNPYRRGDAAKLQ